jgi:uncharacterized YceG family protein
VSGWRQRTDEEREAARRERQQRRAARDGRRPAPAPVPSPVAPPPVAPPPVVSPPPAPPPAFIAELEPEPADTELPAGTRRTYRPRRGARRNPERPHSRAGRILAALALVLAAALIWFLAELFQPFHDSGHGPVTVTIPAHTSSSAVGDLLERDGVVSSAFFFELRALLAGERGNLRAGTYRLRHDMSYGAALAVLTTPPPAAKVTALTITEGKTRRQIATLLGAQGIRGSYLAATRRSRLLDPRRYGAPAGTDTLEGFLFPSTYQLRQPVSAAALADDQLSTFRQRFATIDLGHARSRRVSAYNVLIVASMVEAEAQTAHDRPLIASVIYNRLRARMPLQIDATVRYATGNYATPITVSELRSSSSYNTYVHKGLPPTPIDNPGLTAIQAAASPASTSYLYFVVKPCGNGEHVFASTYAQFLAAAKQYQVARTRRGGRSPARC